MYIGKGYYMSNWMDRFKEFAGKAVEIVSEAADTYMKKREFRRRMYESEILLLSRFAVWQLERICLSEDIPPYVEGKRGPRKARSKNEFIDLIVDELDFEDVVEYAKKFGVRYQDILRDLEELEAELFGEEDIDFQPENEFDEILDLIQKEFRPEMTRDEEDLEKQLAMFLKVHLGEDSVERQVTIEKGKRVDILIDGIYGIEVKIADSTGLAYLPTQLRIYKKRLRDVAAVIVRPIGKEVNIDDILELLDEDGIKYVEVQAEVRRRGRWTFELVKKRKKK